VFSWLIGRPSSAVPDTPTAGAGASARARTVSTCQDASIASTPASDIARAACLCGLQRVWNRRSTNVPKVRSRAPSHRTVPPASPARPLWFLDVARIN
jgi:hypothetical protein